MPPENELQKVIASLIALQSASTGMILAALVQRDILSHEQATNLVRHMADASDDGVVKAAMNGLADGFDEVLARDAAKVLRVIDGGKAD